MSLMMRCPELLTRHLTNTTIFAADVRKARKDKTPMDYIIKKIIGKGSYAEVFLAIDENQNQVAIKRVSKTKKNEDIATRYANEVEAAQRMNGHPGIPNLHCTFEDEHFYYLVLDYCEGSDLFRFMEERKFKPLPEETVCYILKQLTDIVHLAHSKGLVHRDIKLENIIIGPQFKIKLIDFGLCFFPIQSRKKLSLCKDWSGSLEYAAPEILYREPYNAELAEVFSMGTVLCAISTSQFPFSCALRTDTIRFNLNHPELVLPEKYQISSELNHLLHKMLAVEPSARITISDINSHPFCKKYSQPQQTTTTSSSRNLFKSLFS